MKIFTIYHNPHCSKSREALEILQKHQINPKIVEYIKNPLQIEEIKKLAAHFDLKDFVRHSDPLFKELNLSLENDAQVLQALTHHPSLMQRPIVIYEQEAIIARPMTNLLTLIDKIEHC